MGQMMDRRIFGSTDLMVSAMGLGCYGMSGVYGPADDTEAIKRLVESGFGYSVLPEHALRKRPSFFQTFRIEGHRITRGVGLAMVRTDYPRKLTESIANSLQTMLKG